jgi:Ner family transcriptional regulator
MNTSDHENKTNLTDWHRVDIVAALHKKKISLRQLSRDHGYKCETALNNALDRKWPKAERIIAKAIGVEPQVIWPSRYNE